MGNRYCGCKLMGEAALQVDRERMQAETKRVEAARRAVRPPRPQHGLSSSKTGPITSDCGQMRSPRTKWP